MLKPVAKAVLASEEREVPSALTIAFGEVVLQDGHWLPFSLELASGRHRLELGDGSDQIGRCWLGLSPRDEIERALTLLDDVLSGRQDKLKFEPAEPNFALDIERVRLGWVVTCWLDSGNAISDHFTWDGMGVRFFTSTQALADFRQSLLSIWHSVRVNSDVMAGDR